MKILTTRFTTYSSAVFLKILPDVLSFLRRSCRLAPRFFLPLLYSGPFRRLFATFGPLRPPSLRRSGTILRVIHLRAAAIFSWDSPPSWDRFFDCQRHPIWPAFYPSRLEYILASRRSILLLKAYNS
jgi:hypothetical protein